MTSLKEQVLEKLALIKDEPEEKELFFKFNKYAEQIKNVIVDEKTHTPFVIAIHGDWGSGKTSLILEIERLVKKEISEKSKKQWHSIRFDAWEYERVDIVSALFHKIESEYKDEGKKVTEFGKSVGLFLTDAALRKVVGMSLKDTEEHFKKMIDEIPNTKKKIEELTKDGRLIIFVDDLDRCHVDNVLDMLEAIKMFLTAKNVIFVVAVDMKKVERAWKLRYNTEDGSTEGREHVEKIFPLKLSLPPKDNDELKKYVEKLCGSLAETERNLLISGCPSNPRKIKRIANLVYFILKNLDDDESFDKKVPLVIIWCILINAFPTLANIVKRDLWSLFQMASIIVNAQGNEELVPLVKNIDESQRGGRTLNLSVVPIPARWLRTSAIEGLSHVVNMEQDALELLKTVGEFYSMRIKSDRQEDWNKFAKRIMEFESSLVPNLKNVIYHSSLIGN